MRRPLLAVLAFLSLLSTSRAQDALHEAASHGDVPGVVTALAKGGDLNRRDALGRTALMRAAQAGSFHACRELLWAGADAKLTDRSGLGAHDHVGAATRDNAPLRLLLRTYAWLQKEAVRATKKPATPQLVMIMEDTVNYLHPRIQAAYKVNQLEAVGVTGRDDDRNGFVDDVYGWSPVWNKPYTIREQQLKAYFDNREAIARILRIHNDHIEGKLSDEEAANLLDEYTNPLAAIMGPLPGLSDQKFLELLMLSAHGSHVAGIVLDASENTARLHTLAINFTEPSKRMLGPDTERLLDEIHARALDPEQALTEIRAKLLAAATARGRIASKYLQSSGAGVANMSFGGGLGFWRGVVLRACNRCQESRWSLDASSLFTPLADEFVERWALEFYAAATAEYCLLFHENPDVLFVVAAGNEDVNNDDEWTTPAYLGRFFPNVITVAATLDEGLIASFSNYGVESVDLGAPGVNILSTVIPEAPVYMNGTSMAAPYVSGVAALVRSLAPAMSATELRRMLDYTVTLVEQLQHYTSSGGLIDRAALKGLVQGTPRERSHAQARIALNAVFLPDERFPRHAADARAAADKALQLDGTNPEAWQARARVLLQLDQDAAKAFEAIERAVNLGPDSDSAWLDRAGIAAAMGDATRVFASLDKVVALLAARGAAANNDRSQVLALRASFRLQVGERDRATADARSARQLNPGVWLPPELEQLL